MRHAALGGEPGGQTFERAADLDRGVNVALVEGVDDEPAGGKRAQQTFLLEADQGRTDRGAGDAEALDQKRAPTSARRP